MLRRQPIGAKRFGTKIIGSILDVLRRLDVFSLQDVCDIAPVIDFPHRKIVADEIERKYFIPGSLKFQRNGKGLIPIFRQRNLAGGVIGVIDGRWRITRFDPVDHNRRSRRVGTHGQPSVHAATRTESNERKQQKQTRPRRLAQYFDVGLIGGRNRHQNEDRLDWRPVKQGSIGVGK